MIIGFWIIFEAIFYSYQHAVRLCHTFLHQGINELLMRDNWRIENTDGLVKLRCTSVLISKSKMMLRVGEMMSILMSIIVCMITKVHFLVIFKKRTILMMWATFISRLVLLVIILRIS